MSKEGELFYNWLEGRMDILYPDGSTYGGFHCGEMLEVKVKGEWVASCIEYDHGIDSWYLVEGIPLVKGMPVRTRYCCN